MIRDMRIKSGITQEGVASVLGVDRSTVAKWETGRCLPRADLLPKLADILGCTIDELLREKHRERDDEKDRNA